MSPKSISIYCLLFITSISKAHPDIDFVRDLSTDWGAGLIVNGGIIQDNKHSGKFVGATASLLFLNTSVEYQSSMFHKASGARAYLGMGIGYLFQIQRGLGKGGGSTRFRINLPITGSKIAIKEINSRGLALSIMADRFDNKNKNQISMGIGIFF